MGIPHGCAFSNYYVSFAENYIIASIDNKPTLYARDVDDTINIVVESVDHIIEITDEMLNKSVLKL